MSGWVNRHPEKIRFDWSSARSYWPGDLRVQGFQIRVILLTVQWSLSLERARAQVDFPALLDQRFLGRGLVAEGVVLHVRRLLASDGFRRKEAVVAPIPGVEFTPRPLDTEVKAILAAQVRPPPKRIWGVELPQAQAFGMREIWIDEYCYRGAAAAQGSLFLRPREQLDVRFTSLRAGPGEVKLGTQKVLNVRSAHLELGFPRVDTTVYRGSEVWQTLDAKIALAADVPELHFINFYLDRFPGLEVRGTAGVLNIEAAVSKGVLKGAAVLAGRDLRMSDRGITLRGELNLNVSVNRWSFRDKTMNLAGTTASVNDVTIEEAGQRKALAVGWHGEGILREASLNLEVPRQLEARVSGQVQDSRPLFEFFRNGRELPGLLKSALSDRDLKIQASIRLGGDWAEITSLEMTGAQLYLQARLKVEKNARPEGILYFKRGIFALGLETGGKREVKVINPRKWFEAHPLLKGASNP